MENVFLRRLSGRIARSLPFRLWSGPGLTNNGERVDIVYTTETEWRRMDIYQQAHYSRYVFAANWAKNSDTCADLACGTGYGSALLSEVCRTVLGVDRSQCVIETAKQRYQHKKNLRFIGEDLLSLQFDREFDLVVSFETIEHFAEPDIETLLAMYRTSLKASGMLIFSTPYRQPAVEAAKLGFHLTSEIDEDRVLHWLSRAGLAPKCMHYQSYKEPLVQRQLRKPDFLVCMAQHA